MNWADRPQVLSMEGALIEFLFMAERYLASKKHAPENGAWLPGEVETGGGMWLFSVRTDSISLSLVARSCVIILTVSTAGKNRIKNNVAC